MPTVAIEARHSGGPPLDLPGHRLGLESSAAQWSHRLARRLRDPEGAHRGEMKAQLQELKERAQAAGTHEQPRRLQQTPTPVKQPPATHTPRRVVPQPAYKPPPTQQDREARDASWKGAADQAQAQQLEFNNPTQWSAFLAKHPQATDVPHS